MLREDVVGHSHQRVLLDEHRAVLADQCQPVDIGIHDDPQVGLLAADHPGYFGQVLRQRLGVVGEFARGVAVQLHDLAPQSSQQFGHHDAAHRIHGVHNDLVAARTDGLGIDQRERQHLRDVPFVERFARKDAPDAVDGGVFVILLFRHRKHLFPLGIAEEFPVGVEQLQGVPLAGVVRGGDDDAAVGLVRDDGHLDPRRGAQADVYHIRTARQQGAFDQVGDHLARNPGVAADDYGKFFARLTAGGQTGVGRGELHHVGRRQVPGLGPSHGAPDAGNGFNQCHISRL